MTQGWGNGPAGMSRNNWWCGSNEIYGFLGFSLPLEGGCGYSYNSFLSTFRDMKNTYGATFVRIYLPVCTQTSFWVNMVRAAKDTSLAVIPMIFWDFQQNDQKMNAAENAFMGVFTDATVGSIAPYIIHSVAFGDELGEEGNYWVSLMQSFKSRLAQYSIPISITDDWDRSVYKSGNGLSSFGNQINSIDGNTQAHVMPYYHASQAADAYHFWPYFLQQLQFLTNNNMKRPIFITQTCWAYNQAGHQRGMDDSADTMANYIQYWTTINSNCQTFASMKIGWFFHSYQGEPGFDLIGSNGKPVFNFVPTKC